MGEDAAMRIIMLRHGESVGNVDESLFCSIPDHRMNLTETGRRQSLAAGERIRKLIGGKNIDVYVSPYARAWQTLDLLGLQGRTARVREEPRLREQDWGNLQDPARQARQKQERNAFGHFFYRLDYGESGADVYDRVSSFLTALVAPFGMWPRGRGGGGYGHQEYVLLITHGLTMRLACMFLLGWTVAEFERLANPGNGEFRVLTSPLTVAAPWQLDRPFEIWT